VLVLLIFIPYRLLLFCTTSTFIFCGIILFLSVAFLSTVHCLEISHRRYALEEYRTAQLVSLSENLQSSALLLVPAAQTSPPFHSSITCCSSLSSPQLTLPAARFVSRAPPIGVLDVSHCFLAVRYTGVQLFTVPSLSSFPLARTLHFPSPSAPWVSQRCHHHPALHLVAQPWRLYFLSCSMPAFVLAFATAGVINFLVPDPAVQALQMWGDLLGAFFPATMGISPLT
jgi:hypothetical protein